jgi:uncharacterized protein (TIGR00156 family)
MQRLRIIALPLALAAALGTAPLYAQPAAGYTGPSAAPAAAAPGQARGYSGPSSVPLMTVQQLLDTGKDDQQARLQGRIVSHDGDDHYTFADDSGRMRVEIDARRFPAGQTISAEQRVELFGEFDKGLRKKEFEVERMVVMK